MMTDIIEPSVLILMAVYNGEKYIEEQIESIRNQDFTNWHLTIQDDGSTDDTIRIVKEYCRRDPRIELIFNEGGRHGVYYNFHSLANKYKSSGLYDYYMFSDQDDIWLSSKITNMISRFDNSIPQLCYADMKIADSDGHVVSGSINDLLGLKYINKYSVFFSHNVFGCNLMMNQKLFLSVPEIDIDCDSTKILSHDNMYTKFAAVLGKVDYYPEVTMLYRRHGANVTSKQKYSFDIKRIISRVSKISQLAQDHALTYNQSLLTIDILKRNGYGDVRFLDEIEATIRRGGMPALIYVLRKHVSWGKRVKTLSRTAVMVSGLYKKYLYQ